MNLPVARWAIENPIGCLSSRIRKPDQIVHPWQFGDDASKATCLWLKGLPLLRPTDILPGGRKARRANQTASGQNKLGPSPERAMLRAKTYEGIANAMADQWGCIEMAIAPWIPCPCECGNYWCTIHEMHAFECECPEIDEWDTDPYSPQETSEPGRLF